MTRLGLAAGLAATCVCLVAAVPVAAAPSAPSSSVMPVPNGAYGYADVLDPDMVLFKVRNRKIINPRFSITVECQHSDGTTQSLTVGPTESDPSRRFRIPRDGDSRVSWSLPFDPSLIPDGTAHMGFHWYRNQRPQVTIEFEADYSEVDPATGEPWHSSCYGVRPFQVDRGPLR